MASKKIIQIGENEYRLSGKIEYFKNCSKSVIVDGETYYKQWREHAIYDIDLDWEQKERILFCGPENDIPVEEIKFHNWHKLKTNFMNWFNKSEIEFWYPTEFNNYNGCVPMPENFSTNNYINILMNLSECGALGIELSCGKIYREDDYFNIIIDGYGFNNSIHYQATFQEVLNLNLKTVLQHSDLSMHKENLLKSILLKFPDGIIPDVEKVFLLVNHINTLRAA